MTTRQPYSYVLLRYQHDPLAGEIINVGVLMYAPSANFVGAKVRKTLGRLGKVFPGVQKSEISAALATIEHAATDAQSALADNRLFSTRYADAQQLALSILPADDSSYVWGELYSGLTTDPEKTLDQIYLRFVSRYDDENKTGRDDSSVWQPVRDVLTARRLVDRLQPKTITSPVDEVEFGNAWKNGVWHCYQALSFDLMTADGIRQKAARWSGHMTGLSKADEMVQPYFIVGAPTHPELVKDYERAIELLRASALEPKVFEESQSEELADLITEQMNHSRSGHTA